MTSIRSRSLLLLQASVLLVACGKGSAPPPAAGPQAQKVETATTAKPVAATAAPADWCGEHGVPESVCTRCNTSLISQFKAKGDWCDKHDRPDSQCFVCHPEHEAKFAAQY